MRIESLIPRCISIVDRALRATFPDDYDKRCMYAAFGLRDLLKTTGHAATIVGGEFLAFTVSQSESEASLQGFGLGAGEPSHYWVEVAGSLLDLGPHYLPRSSSYPAAKMPIVAWLMATPLPPYLRYRAAVRYDPDVELQSNPATTKRMQDFLGECLRRHKAQIGQSKLASWLLTDASSLSAAAKAGDVWARHALRFERQTKVEQLPF